MACENKVIANAKVSHSNWGKPHHARSTVKSVFLLACLLDALPYIAVKCKPTLHQVHGVLTNITSNMWSANHSMRH